MPREEHVKSVPGVLLCPSMYHQPGHEKGKEMQSWYLFIYFRRMTCGILVPRPGIELEPPVVKTQSLTCSAF